MNTRGQWFVAWPHVPELPPPGMPVLIRVRANAPRERVRGELRSILRHVIASWSGHAPELMPLHETAHGPQWRADLAGHSLDISVSYSQSDAWIGLLCGGTIGVDAITRTTFAEMALVGPLFLGPESWRRVCRSLDPVRAFALAWTGLEARLKCMKQPLTEWPDNEAHPLTNSLEARQYEDDHSIVSVVTGPSRTGACTP
jgi:phosphopantetheinyl transferase